MIWLVLSTLAALILLVGLQIVWAWRLASLYPPVATQPDPDDWPKVAVLLSLRGADPSLKNCLQGLLHLNYPNYTIFVTVDSESDPAWEMLHSVVVSDDLQRLEIRVLKNPSHTCTLKMSCLLQRLDELDESYDVVALIDADAHPHADWLRDLVRPLADPKVGMVSGLRWFLPGQPTWGSLLRAVWNAAATTQMIAFQVPWGGSLAFRAEFFRNPDLLAKWSRSFCEDVSAVDILTKAGLQMRFAPAATMVSTETVDMGPCMRFIRRQVVCVRLYHPRWNFMAGVALVTTLALFWTETFFVILCICQEWFWASFVGSTLVGVSVTFGALLNRTDIHIRQLAEDRGDSSAPFSWKVLIIGPSTMGLYVIAMLWGILSRRVDWRGITYDVKGPLDIRMLEYRTYVNGQKGESNNQASVI